MYWAGCEWHLKVIAFFPPKLITSINSGSLLIDTIFYLTRETDLYAMAYFIGLTSH